jgi:hypothetical protein
MYIDNPDVKELLEKRLATPVDAKIIRQFDSYLRTLPWLGTTLNWRLMPPWESFRLTLDNAREATEWAKRMAVGKGSHVVVAYKSDEPGLRCTLEAAMQHLGSLFGRAPGSRFLFGTNERGTEWVYDFAALMEFDGGEVFKAVCVPSKNA